MEITIFAKKRQSKDGRTFYTYLSTLTKKTTGEQVTVQVKFRQDAGQPDPHACPMNIVFDKADANYTEKLREIENENGEKVTIHSNTLWVSKWETGSAYVDTSMDDF